MAKPPDKERGIDATNRDFLAYDQVHKDQSYRLAAGKSEEFDEAYEVATCDMARCLRGDDADRAAFAQELGRSLEDIGFAILVGHGIDPALHARAGEIVERLFTGHVLADKMRFRAQRYGSVNQGYFPIEETSDIHPDLVEGWVFCRRAFAMEESAPPALADFWPDPSAEPVLRAMCAAQEQLILPLMQSILRYLGCDPHLYDARLRGTNFGLRLNYYPPLTPAQLERGAGRLLGHEDIDLFTLLPAPQAEGLQVLHRKSFKWVRLHAPPGSIILNTGDYMQRITNDRLPSTTHRVSPPRDPALQARARVSFPMNVYLWEDEVLEVLPGLGTPRYPPVRALQFHTRTTAKFYGDGYAVE